MSVPALPRRRARLLGPALVAATLILVGCSSTEPTGQAWTRALAASESDPRHLRFVDLDRLRELIGDEQQPADRSLLSYGVPFGALPPEHALEAADWILASGGTTRLAGAADTLDDWAVTEAGTELSTDGEDLLMRREGAGGSPEGLADDSPARLLADCLAGPDVVTLYQFQEPVPALADEVVGFALGSTFGSRQEADHRVCLLLPQGADTDAADRLAGQARQGATGNDSEQTFTVTGTQVQDRVVGIDLDSAGQDQLDVAAQWHLGAPEARAPWFQVA